MKKLPSVLLLIFALLFSSSLASAQTTTTHFRPFNTSNQLNTNELAQVDGEGPVGAAGAAVIGAIGGGVVYGVTTKHRTPGGWFTAIAGGAAAGAAATIFAPTP